MLPKANNSVSVAAVDIRVSGVVATGSKCTDLRMDDANLLPLAISIRSVNRYGNLSPAADWIPR